MIQVLTEAGSTSGELAARLREGGFVAEGEWLVADRQSAGRGRQGRAWIDGAGNFMGSTLVRLARGDPPAGTLALAAGLALHEVVAPALPARQHAWLKWPNDLMVGAAKLAGILLEREGEAVIVGVGVNLAQAPELPERRTVALADLGPAPGRDAFAARLARSFALELERWRGYGAEPIVSRWLAAAHPLGTPLSIDDGGDEPLAGTFAGLSADGALQLRLAGGTTRSVHAGEVRLAGA